MSSDLGVFYHLKSAGLIGPVKQGRGFNTFNRLSHRSLADDLELLLFQVATLASSQHPVCMDSRMIFDPYDYYHNSRYLDYFSCSAAALLQAADIVLVQPLGKCNTSINQSPCSTDFATEYLLRVYEKTFLAFPSTCWRCGPVEFFCQLCPYDGRKFFVFKFMLSQPFSGCR